MLRVSPDLGRDWDAIAEDAPHTASSRWLRLAEDRLPGSLTFRYVRDGQTHVAMRGLVLLEPMEREWLDPFLIASGGATHLGLAAGGPHPWRDREPETLFPCLAVLYPNYDAFPVGPGVTDPAVLRHFLDELDAWRAANGIRSAAFLYLTPEAMPLCEVAREDGFHVFPLTTRAEMGVTWTDFDGYLATLPSKRRTCVRRELRAVSEAGVSVEITGLAEVEADLIQLRCMLMAKYLGSARADREARWFTRIREAFLVDEITVFVARANNRPVAFSLFVRDGACWTALLTGMDYGIPEARFSHFATMYYAPAEHAPRISVSRIFYGIASQETKHYRGCSLTPLMAAVSP
jgi:hypothetical protein